MDPMTEQPHRKVPSDEAMRQAFADYPSRTDTAWGRVWGVTSEAVRQHRSRLNIPSVRERRAILEGRRA